MWLIAAVQSIDPLNLVAASTALTSFLVSVVVGKDRRSRPTDHGKQTIAAAEVPPDSKVTNRTSIAEVFHYQHGDQVHRKRNRERLGISTEPSSEKRRMTLAACWCRVGCVEIRKSGIMRKRETQIGTFRLKLYGTLQFSHQRYSYG
jgi:hypothetical protein